MQNVGRKCKKGLPGVPLTLHYSAEKEREKREIPHTVTYTVRTCRALNNLRSSYRKGLLWDIQLEREREKRKKTLEAV